MLPSLPRTLLHSSCFLFSICFVLADHPALAQRDKSFSQEFSQIWRRSTEYTLAVAEAMPESGYSYKPHEGEEGFTFAQQMIHIAENLYWLNSTYIIGEKNPLKNDRLAGNEKGDVVKLLRDALKYVSNSAGSISDADSREPVRFADEDMDKQRIFYLMRDHMTHHRAQAILYLRLNGIDPPRYRGY